MEPYYQDEFATIYHGNCREVMDSRIPSADLCLTDPPFFMPATHYQSRVKWQRSWSDTSVLATFWQAIVLDVKSVLRETGHFIAFCNGDSYPVFYPEMYRHFDFLKCLVWNKGHVGLGRVWRNQHELAIAARWNESVFYEDGKLRADVMDFSATPSSDRDHPVQKPVSLLADLITVTTPTAGVVLDPFMGSGTTLGSREATRPKGHRNRGRGTLLRSRRQTPFSRSPEPNRVVADRRDESEEGKHDAEGGRLRRVYHPAAQTG